MSLTFTEKLHSIHQNFESLPSNEDIFDFLDHLFQILFPEFTHNLKLETQNDINQQLIDLEIKLKKILNELSNCPVDANTISDRFFKILPSIHQNLLKDAQAINDGDPAAINKSEVIRSYPGFYGISVYRIAHFFYEQKVPFLPRILTEFAHTKTGIDIHPGAVIGESFFIDHGTGIVIGETTIIGKNVKIFQGVTLGGLSVSKDLANSKRHPTIEDNVVIYAGATILGGKTVVGAGSLIGGNVWLVESVPENTRVYHKSQIHISK